MAGKDVGYRFLDALAKSVGMDTESVKLALAEINQLQTQTQALEGAVRGKAPTNHASKQATFGTANALMYGHVKIAREVTNDSTDGVAVSPDAVYAYAPNRDTTPLGTVTRTNASIYMGSALVDITAYAQISGNAVVVCWDNPLGKGIDRAKVVIPGAYKFKIFNDYDTFTNLGAKVKVSYSADNVLTVKMPIMDTAFDSILILMEPKNV